MKVKQVDETTFDTEVLHASEPVLVDFYAPWCPPCRGMLPVLDEVSTELEGRAKVVKVNVDETPTLAAEYGVNSIPAFAVVKEGKVLSRFDGARPKQSLLEELEPHLN